MDCEEIKKQRGGRREGAGRPKGDSKLYTFRVPGYIASDIDAQESKTEFIKECIVKNIFAKHSIEEFGDVVRASEVKDLTLPFFENVSVVAGFPIPLDNDEKAQNIELLQMLCPHPESCYLIRVQGNSMIDANIYSGNMMLYAAMSRRIVSILRKSIMHVENYSIDESFCDLNGYDKHYNLEELMRGVADKIRLYTDVPVSVGIAPTKTLAKMGSKFAKQYKGYRDVCVIDTEEKRRKALELFDLADVWGVGRSVFLLCRLLKSTS
ncbi:MAG: hypothetical protein MJ069_07305 [Salinivirgaceae bacterium]|nr:hypothetical protein [Salinivirgaceae bacterium]